MSADLGLEILTALDGWEPEPTPRDDAKDPGRLVAIVGRLREKNRALQARVIELEIAVAELESRVNQGGLALAVGRRRPAPSPTAPEVPCPPTP